MADSAKAKNSITRVRKNKNTNEKFKELKQKKEERGFLPALKDWVSTSSMR
jgi:hypothetical protein